MLHSLLLALLRMLQSLFCSHDDPRGGVAFHRREGNSYNMNQKRYGDVVFERVVEQAKLVVIVEVWLKLGYRWL